LILAILFGEASVVTFKACIGAALTIDELDALNLLILILLRNCVKSMVLKGKSWFSRLMTFFQCCRHVSVQPPSTFLVIRFTFQF
jgi:hypothetical protein